MHRTIFKTRQRNSVDCKMVKCVHCGFIFLSSWPFSPSFVSDCLPPPSFSQVRLLSLLSARMKMNIGISSKTDFQRDRLKLFDICNICCLFSNLCSLYFCGELLFLPPVTLVLFNFSSCLTTRFCK